MFKYKQNAGVFMFYNNMLLFRIKWKTFKNEKDINELLLFVVSMKK